MVSATEAWADSTLSDLHHQMYILQAVILNRTYPMNKITDLYSVNLYFSQLYFQFPCIAAVKNKLWKNKLGSVEWEILIYVGEWSMGLAT